MVTVYRVQDASGRGPWRPGFSHRWIEAEAPAGRLTESLLDLLTPAQVWALPRSHHYGAGCRRLADLGAWFLPAERARLRALGFWPVQVSAEVVVIESSWQIFVGRVRPFAEGATRRAWAALG
jgi:hypothetical protein